MKFNGDGGFDGLDKDIKLHAAADGFGDGPEGSGLFDDDDEDEEVVVVVTSDDDDEDELGRLAEEVDEMLEPHAEEAIIVVAPPSPVQGYTPATAMSKAPEKAVAPSAVKTAAKKAPAKKAPAKKAVAKKAPAKKAVAKKASAKKATK